ncbi:hypothetical protein Ancab_014269, partial [Ancistrocladus abbreviatus]
VVHAPSPKKSMAGTLMVEVMDKVEWRESEKKAGTVGELGLSQLQKVEISTEQVEGSGPNTQWAKVELGCGEKCPKGARSRKLKEGVFTDCRLGGRKPKYTGAK